MREAPADDGLLADRTLEPQESLLIRGSGQRSTETVTPELGRRSEQRVQIQRVGLVGDGASRVLHDGCTDYLGRDVSRVQGGLQLVTEFRLPVILALLLAAGGLVLRGGVGLVVGG